MNDTNCKNKLKENMPIHNIQKTCKNSSYEYFGIRADNIKYQVGDICNNSHQLYQDPKVDENGELIYPYIEDGLYAGFYDAGELNGSCAIRFNPEDENSIQRAFDIVNCYYGDWLHVIAGNMIENGNDDGEIIIRSAEVLFVMKREEN